MLPVYQEAPGFQGNPHLKPCNYKIEYTAEMIREYQKCADDPIYFITNYVSIVTLDGGLVPFKLYDCQKEKLKIIHNNRKILLMESRQSGKCCEKDTKYTIRNKKTGEVLNVTAEEFHKMCKLSKGD